MANINAQLAGANLQVIDNAASTQRVNSPIATLVAQATASFYDAYFAVTNGAPTAITLPAATIWTVGIRNLSGANNITIIGTPATGVAWASGYVLVPSGLFLTIASYSTNPGAGGFTAISIGASGAGTFAEIFLAG